MNWYGAFYGNPSFLGGFFGAVRRAAGVFYEAALSSIISAPGRPSTAVLGPVAAASTASRTAATADPVAQAELTARQEAVQ